MPWQEDPLYRVRTQFRVGSILFLGRADRMYTVVLRRLRFSERCCWGFGSSETWRSVAGWVVQRLLHPWR